MTNAPIPCLDVSQNHINHGRRSYRGSQNLFTVSKVIKLYTFYNCQLFTRIYLGGKRTKQIHSQGEQLGAIHPLPILKHPPGICKISVTYKLISLIKKLAISYHNHITSVKLPWLETTPFQKFIHNQDVLCNVIERIM